MKSKRAFLIVRIVAAILAVMYLDSGLTFIFTEKISFIGYQPNGYSEVWVVRNLGGRLLGIGLGLLLAAISHSPKTLAILITVRLTADIVDFINSIYTPSIDPLIAQIVGVFILIEVACLFMLFRIVRTGSEIT